MKYVKILLSLAFFGMMGYFLYLHFSDGQIFLTLLQKVNTFYLIMALVLQLVYYYFWVSLFRNSFKVFGIHWSFKTVLKDYFKAYAIGLMTPLGGSAGMGVYVNRAKEDNISTTTTLAAVWVGTIVFYMEIVLLWAVTYFIMRYYGWLHGYQVTAWVVLAITVLTVVGLLNFGVVAPRVIESLFKGVQWVRNVWRRAFKLKKPQLEQWAVRKTTEWVGIANVIMQQRNGILGLFRDSFFLILLNAATMFLLFLGVGYIVPISQLVAGVSIPLLFSIISPTPQGIGFVEPLLTSAFLSFGIDTATASVVALSFRVITVWLPVLIGIVVISRTQIKAVVDAAAAGSIPMQP